MAEERKHQINLENLGLALHRPEDSRQPGHYTRLLNMESNREGFLESRKGSASLGSLAAGIHSQGRLISADVNYQAAGTVLYRDLVQIATGMGGGFVTMRDYKINNSAVPHMVFWDSAKRLKDSGSGTPTQFGIDKPPSAITSAPLTPQTKTVDAMDDHTQYAASNATLATDTGIKKEGTGSVKITVAADTTGTASRTFIAPIDLSQFSTPGDGDDKDFIHIWVRVDRPDRLEEIRLQIDVDPATHDFQQNFYTKSISPSEIQQIVEGQGSLRAGEEILIDVEGIRGPFFTPFDDDRIRQAEPVILTLGRGQWTEFFIRKEDFTRAGSAGEEWENAAAVQIWVKTKSDADGPVIVHVDDLKMQGGVDQQLDGDADAGTGYDWRMVYVNNSTGTISPFSPVGTPGTFEKQAAQLTLVNSSDAQVDKIDIYRRGGTLTDNWYFAKRVDVVSDLGAALGDGLSYQVAEGLSDLDLNEVIPTDHIDFPLNATSFEIAADRFWLDDEDNPDRVWFTKRFKEELQAASYIIVSKGGDRVKRVFGLDDQLFVFTDKTVYRIRGQGETSFTPTPTGVERGLYAKYAITRGVGRIFYRTWDGIYALLQSGQISKLSEAIDLIFHGLSFQEMFPVDNAARNDERLQYYDNKLYWAYKDSQGLRREIVYDLIQQRWMPTDRQPLSYLRIADDVAGPALLSGEGTSLIQRETGNQDPGPANVSYHFRTMAYDFGEMQEEKNFTEVVFDADTGGQNVTVTAFWDNATSSAVLGTINTSDRQQVILPVNGGDGVFARNIALHASGSNGNSRVRFWKIICNFWVEPRESRRLLSDWTDLGDPRRKFLRQLLVDLDTQGTTATVRVFLDGSASAAKTFAAVSTTNRQKLTLDMDVDTEATQVRVKIDSDSATLPIKVYSWQFPNALPQGLRTDFYQSEWEGFEGGDAFLRTLALEIDTLGLAVSVIVEIDDADAHTFASVTTADRKVVYLSLPADTRGAKARLKISGNPFVYYNHKWDALPDRPGYTAHQTSWSDDGSQQDKWYEHLVLDIDTQNQSATVGIQVDGASVHSSAVNTGADRLRAHVSLPIGVRGRMSRLVITAANPFRYYGHDWQAEEDRALLGQHRTVWDSGGTPAEKYYRTLILDVEGRLTGLEPATVNDLTVTVEIDNDDAKVFTVNTSGLREVVHLALDHDTKGRESRIRIESNFQFRYYGHVFDTIPLALQGDKSQTDWSDDGHSGVKFYRTLILDIDTLGNSLRVDYELDDGTTAFFSNVSTTGRQTLYLSIPTDTRASKSRIKISNGAFELYSHKWDVLPDRENVTTYQTEWQADGSPAMKFYRTLLLDIDGAATVNVDVDDTTGAASFSINTTARDLLHLAMPIGTEGKQSRLRISGAFRYYGHRFDTIENALRVAPAAGQEFLTDWSEDGGAGAKFYRTLVLVIDTFSTTVDAVVELVSDELDTSPRSVTFAGLSTNGREPLVLAFPQFDERAVRSRVKIRQNAVTPDASFQYFGHHMDWAQDTLAIDRFQTVPDFDGTREEKFYRDLMLEINTNGASATVTVEIDGSDAETFQATTSARQEIFHSMAADTRGRVSRIKISGTNFRYYSHSWRIMQDAAAIDIAQTEWNDSGHPCDKRYRQLFLDLDTQGLPATIDFQVDGASADSFQVTTAGRRRIVHSLPLNTIGKLSRLVTSVNPVRLYAHSTDAKNDPCDVTIHDTYDLSFGYPRWKFARRIYFAVQAPAQVTLSFFVDGSLRDTAKFTANALNGHWMMVLVKLPAGKKGRLFRLQLTSASAFKLFGAVFEWHALAGERGYQLADAIEAHSKALSR